MTWLVKIFVPSSHERAGVNDLPRLAIAAILCLAGILPQMAKASPSPEEENSVLNLVATMKYQNGSLTLDMPMGATLKDAETWTYAFTNTAKGIASPPSANQIASPLQDLVAQALPSLVAVLFMALVAWVAVLFRRKNAKVPILPMPSGGYSGIETARELLERPPAGYIRVELRNLDHDECRLLTTWLLQCDPSSHRSSVSIGEGRELLVQINVIAFWNQGQLIERMKDELESIHKCEEALAHLKKLQQDDLRSALLNLKPEFDKKEQELAKANDALRKTLKSVFIGLFEKT